MKLSLLEELNIVVILRLYTFAQQSARKYVNFLGYYNDNTQN